MKRKVEQYLREHYGEDRSYRPLGTDGIPSPRPTFLVYSSAFVTNASARMVILAAQRRRIVPS